MNSKTIYSAKAEKYARYRWDYAPEAIQAILDTTNISLNSTMADIGAGTGILTRHFADKTRRIYAVEPNLEMRQILSREMASFPSVAVLDGCAENTTLPGNSVDVITVAQAIHWFDPEPATQELMRILKGSGWLALLRNYEADKEKDQAIGSLMTEEYGADFTVQNKQPEQKPAAYYYGNGSFQRLTFPFEFEQTCEEFIGALTTASFMPDEDHPLFQKLETKARQVFAEYSQGGYWLSRGETELVIGQPAP
jgi:ubiquinone/menaquinone biosynthesis C-methylase UbiE